MFVLVPTILLPLCVSLSGANDPCLSSLQVKGHSCQQISADCGLTLDELVRSNPHILSFDKCSSPNFVVDDTICCGRKSQQLSGSGAPDVCKASIDGSRFVVGTSFGLGSAKNADDCLSQCSSAEACRFFDFHKPSKTCQQFSSVVGSEKDADWAFGCV